MENTHIIDVIVENLRKGADELEQLQVQAALGKMEAGEQFEAYKKAARLKVHDLKVEAIKADDKFREIVSKLQELEVQLDLGKAETKEKLEEQIKKIRLAFHELKVAVKTNPTVEKITPYVVDAMEDLELRLAVLEDALDPARQKAAELVEKAKKEAEAVIDAFKTNTLKEKLEERADVFSEEISKAYQHLKNAFIQK